MTLSDMILTGAMIYAQIALALAVCLATWRLLLGRRAQDRVIALDAAYIATMLLLLVTSMRLGAAIFFEAAMIMGVIGFVASLALAKFLLRGEVIE